MTLSPRMATPTCPDVGTSSERADLADGVSNHSAQRLRIIESAGPIQRPNPANDAEPEQRLHTAGRPRRTATNADLDAGHAYGSEGRGFESLRARFPFLQVSGLRLRAFRASGRCCGDPGTLGGPTDCRRRPWWRLRSDPSCRLTLNKSHGSPGVGALGSPEPIQREPRRVPPMVPMPQRRSHLVRDASTCTRLRPHSLTRASGLFEVAVGSRGGPRPACSISST